MRILARKGRAIIKTVGNGLRLHIVQMFCVRFIGRRLRLVWKRWKRRHQKTNNQRNHHKPYLGNTVFERGIFMINWAFSSKKVHFFEVCSKYCRSKLSVWNVLIVFLSSLKRICWRFWSDFQSSLRRIRWSFWSDFRSSLWKIRWWFWSDCQIRCEWFDDGFGLIFKVRWSVDGFCLIFKVPANLSLIVFVWFSESIRWWFLSVFKVRCDGFADGVCLIFRVRCEGFDDGFYLIFKVRAQFLEFTVKIRW